MSAHANTDATDVFGFWLYIMTDCLLFASLFATFLVLNYPGAVGPALKEHINLPYVLWETFFLLASNFTYCLEEKTGLTCPSCRHPYQGWQQEILFLGLQQQARP